MMDIVKKRHKSFHWTEEAEKSFNLLKRKIMEQPILVFPYLMFGKNWINHNCMNFKEI
jgi:hypothetical protein